jgi:glyoxylase-like metal-dependent hydrolase (beta-lactamase superfamily II)
MRVHCISTGAVRLKRGERGARRYLAGGWRHGSLPVNVFAIEHPDGVCLFDTGQTARAASNGYFPRWYPFFRLARFELGQEDEAAAQLRRVGLDPEAVRWIVLSHLHTDHVGGLAGFPGAEVFVSRREWRRAKGLAGHLRGYLPHHWPAGLTPRLVDVPPAPLGPFASHVDVAGDGRLLLVPTPGHTPGHMALLVCSEERSYLCGGDICESPAELPEAAPEVARFCRDRGVVFLASHDPRAAELTASGTR